MLRTKVSFLLILAVAVYCRVGMAVEDGTVIYKAGKVITLSGEPLVPGEVAVADGKIQAVGSGLDAAGKTVVDLGEEIVLIPGLVDAYSTSAIGNGGGNEFTEEITINFRAADSVDLTKEELIRQRKAGTTTMCVCPGTENVIAGVSTVIKTVGESPEVLMLDGPLVASLCNDPSRRNGSRSRPDSIYIRQPTNRMGVVWLLRNTFQKANSASPLDGKSILNEVIAKKRPIMVVSRLSHDINTVATLDDEFGFSPIIVGGQEAYKVKDLLADRKYPIILQNIGTGNTRGTENSELCWNQAELLRESEVQFALSGDNLLEQARFAHRYGLPEMDALRAIASTPAKILGVDKRVGTIEVGKDADLVALNGNPLELTSAIRWVMVDGDIIDNQKED